MFGFGKNRFLGIDVGTSSIKIAEIKVSGGRPVLVNYGWMKIGKGEGDVKPTSFDATLPEYLKRIVKESEFKSKNGYISLPAFGGLITLIEFPEMTEEDLAQAIKFEAHKYIPTSLDDIALSWDVVSKKSTEKIYVKKESEINKDSAGVQSSKLQVLLVAAPKSKVEKYEKLAKSAGISLKAIEIESFSIVRALVGNDQGNFLIIDIGSRVCNIILVEKSVIKVNRNIDAGGRDITKIIAKSMDVDEERAEKIKISEENFLKKESSMSFPALELIIGEARRAINAYYKEAGAAKLDGIILSGGTAGLSGIADYFSQTLQVKVTIGNPFMRIEYDKKLDSIIKKIAPQFSVCVGLALKGMEEYSKK